MNQQHFTPSENTLLNKVDALLELCPVTHEALPIVSKFAEELALLREKRELINLQSVKRHAATSNKETAVAEVTTERESLVIYLNDALGMLSVYARKEKDTSLTKVIAQMVYSELVRQKPLVLIASLNTLAAAVEKLDADTLAQYGIDKTWLPTLKTKILAYKTSHATKETLKTNKPIATGEFKTVVSDIQDHLATLTDLMGGYKDKAPEFYTSLSNLLGVKKKTTKSAAKKKVPKKSKITPPIVVNVPVAES